MTNSPRNHLPLEAFEDDSPSTGSKSSYDLLAEICGTSASNLKSYATIKRLKPNCEMYKNINECVVNGGSGVAVKQIFKIERKNEREPFDDKYRIMLWHGTSGTKVAGIIQSGFMKGSGGLYGGGIYFADRLAKSQGYGSLFVLAEVAPGRVYKAHYTHSNYSSPPAGYDSVKGMGSSIPNWKKNKYYYGAILPCGETVTNKRHPSFNLGYNEYIQYDSDKIIVRFVVNVG